MTTPNRPDVYLESELVRLTEQAAAAEPAEAIDAAMLLDALGANRSIDALRVLAARLVAGCTLPADDVAEALARLSRIEHSRIAQARSAAVNSARRRGR